MLSQIEEFVNWVRRRNPQARTWRDYAYDLQQFAASVGDRPPGEVTFRDIDLFIVQPGRARASSPPPSTAAWPPSWPSTPTWPTKTRPWSVPSCLAATTCASRSACRARFRKKTCTLLRRHRDELSIVPATGPCSSSCCAAACASPKSPACCCPTVTWTSLTRAWWCMAKAPASAPVYLSPQAERALRLYLAERPACHSDFVFLSYQGEGLSTTAIHKRLMRYREQAGVRLTAHRLRHSFANDLLSAGAPVTSIQELWATAGWRPPRST